MRNFFSEANKTLRRKLKTRAFRNMPLPQLEKKVEDWYYQRTETVFGHGLKLDLKNPRTFNEKLQWLKIYEQSARRTHLADKYLAKKLVAEIIGPEHIVPLYGVWNRFSDINFNRLPDKFVLKANHGSAWNLLVRDKSQLDYTAAKEKFDECLIRNYAYAGFELQYRDIKPKIFAEAFLPDKNLYVYDYRFWCFNGRPELFLITVVDEAINLTCTYFDMDFNHLPSLHAIPEVVDLPPKPASFDLMVDFSKKLSKDFSFVRVDFYEINGHPYFGEMTFQPNRGVTPWRDLKNDLYYGNMLKLPFEKSGD